MEQSNNTSQHLVILRCAGVVATERKGKFAFSVSYYAKTALR